MMRRGRGELLGLDVVHGLNALEMLMAGGGVAVELGKEAALSQGDGAVVECVEKSRRSSGCRGGGDGPGCCCRGYRGKMKRKLMVMILAVG